MVHMQWKFQFFYFDRTNLQEKKSGFYHSLSIRTVISCFFFSVLHSIWAQNEIILNIWKLCACNATRKRYLCPVGRASENFQYHKTIIIEQMENVVNWSIENRKFIIILEYWFWIMSTYFFPIKALLSLARARAYSPQKKNWINKLSTAGHYVSHDSCIIDWRKAQESYHIHTTANSIELIKWEINHRTRNNHMAHSGWHALFNGLLIRTI